MWPILNVIYSGLFQISRGNNIPSPHKSHIGVRYGYIVGALEERSGLRFGSNS